MVVFRSMFHLQHRTRTISHYKDDTAAWILLNLFFTTLTSMFLFQGFCFNGTVIKINQEFHFGRNPGVSAGKPAVRSGWSETGEKFTGLKASWPDPTRLQLWIRGSAPLSSNHLSPAIRVVPMLLNVFTWRSDGGMSAGMKSPQYKSVCVYPEAFIYSPGSAARCRQLPAAGRERQSNRKLCGFLTNLCVCVGQLWWQDVQVGTTAFFHTFWEELGKLNWKSSALER